ncbi:MAG: two-component regulator propeller domain-containing protein, partial [Flavipsychrobacter sp.]
MKIFCRYTYRFILLISFAFTSSGVNAQKYPFHNLNVENGLIQSQAGALVQDKIGHLWVGTLGGLCRYDGKTFVNYTVRNGLLNNYIRSLAIDSKGTIWIGCATGVSQYDGKIFKNYLFQSTDNTLSNDVKYIGVGLQDSVWCVAGGRLYCIANNKIIPIRTGQDDISITAMLVDQSNIWIAKANGTISYRNNGKWDSLRIGMTPTGRMPIVTSIYKDHQHRIWLTTNGGLYKIQNHAVTVDSLGQLPLYNLPTLYSITEDNNGALWIGTSSGVIRLSNNLIQYYNKHNGLSDNIFGAALTDAEGNVWLASDGQGIFRYSGTQFTTLDETMGLPSGQITALAGDRAGRLYLGTYDAGMAIFENGKISLLPLPAEMKSAITSLTVHRGKVWIGTRNGLWRYDRIFRSYTYPEHHFPSNIVSCLYADKQDRLWVGFVNGAVVLDNDTFKRVPTKGLTVQDFIAIGKDSILMATNGGIKLYTDHNVTPYRTNTILDSSDLQCFALKGNELWVGTGDNGVIRLNLNTKQIAVYNKQNGLQSDFIYNIITDNDGNIWLGTGYGLHKISIDNKGQATISFYGKGQGLAGMESNHNSVFKMQDSSIWFGTTNGAIHYQPHTAIVAAEPISIIMQSVKLFGVNITDTSYFDSTDSWNNVPYGLHLPYQKNNLTFAFQAISLSGGDQLLYRYYMEGLDAPWSEWSTTNSITFSALPPGNYVLH